MSADEIPRFEDVGPMTINRTPSPKNGPTVPRRASFDDLRAGMTVAVSDEKGYVWGGVIDKWMNIGGAWRVVEDPDDGDHQQGFIDRTTDGTLTILRDPPAAPVTVRREDYDALLRELHRLDSAQGGSELAVVNTARALIVSADTGDDQ